MESGTITLDATGIMLHSEPIAVHESFIELTVRQGDEICVIGRLKATFDFKSIPPDFHAMVLNHLVASGQTWSVGGIISPGTEYPVLSSYAVQRTNTPPMNHVVSWFERFFQWFKR